LHRPFVGDYVDDVVKLRSVNVTERVGVEEVVEGMNKQLLTE
jgi:hypothetical protein